MRIRTRKVQKSWSSHHASVADARVARPCLRRSRQRDRSPWRKEQSGVAPPVDRCKIRTGKLSLSLRQLCVCVCVCVCVCACPMLAQTYCIRHTAYRQCKKSSQAAVQANHPQCLVVVDDCVQVCRWQQRINHSRMQNRNAHRATLVYCLDRMKVQCRSHKSKSRSRCQCGNSTEP